jgi:hypothetical protein
VTKPAVNRRPGSIWGLAFVPTLAPGLTDTQDTLPGYLSQRGGPDDNSPAALNLVAELAAWSTAVLEIGVALYAPEKSFTPRLVAGLTKSGRYLGVDVADRSAVTRLDPRAHFLQASSFDQDAVRGRLDALGMGGGLDLLLIDGCHSVEACLNDWRYAELVKAGGLVLIHDTNSHPGPVALAAAIDRDVFAVEEPLAGAADYGLAICRRIR